MLRTSSFLEVRLQNIAHNVHLIRTHYAPKAKLIAMVKGQAYGNGLTQVSSYLHDACDVHHFGVASLGEALAILAANPDTIDSGRDNRIVICSDTEVSNEQLWDIYAKQNAKHASGRGAQLMPVLGNEDQVRLFCANRKTIFRNTPLCLKVNTGMNRLGITSDRLSEFAPLLRENGGVDLLMQHFSVSGLVGHSFTKSQYNNFLESKEILASFGVEVRGTSASNSGAIEQRLGVDETYVRPGLMLYGPSSIAKKSISEAEAKLYRPWDGICCGYFYSKVLHHYVAKAGSYIGYGMTRNLVPEDAVVVLISVGYADGFLRYYANMPIAVSPAPPPGQEEDPAVKAAAVVGLVHGNVNMDMSAVVVYPSQVQRGVEEIMSLVKDDSCILMWGNDIAAKAASVKTIPYQLMCGLSVRVPRRYVRS